MKKFVKISIQHRNASIDSFLDVTSVEFEVKQDESKSFVIININGGEMYYSKHHLGMITVFNTKEMIYKILYLSDDYSRMFGGNNFIDNYERNGNLEGKFRESDFNNKQSEDFFKLMNSTTQ